MCGRFTLHTEKEVLIARFDLDPADLELAPWTPRYNIAPTQSVLTVIERDGRRRAGYMRWGLVPHWTKPDAELPSLINARAETAASRPAFRDSFRRKRCWVLASGFYEWQAARGASRRKTPHWIARKDGAPFAMAGLWATWRPPAGPAVHSCTILTTQPNALVRELHDRMPVILQPDHEAAWLDAALDVPALEALLVPVEAGELFARPVSLDVNRTRNDSAGLIEPSDDPQLGFL